MRKWIRSEVFWILLLAAVLRFAYLGVKPPHFDEGVNGWFVDQMVKNGYFQYDPTNYHGPLYFYLLFVSEHLFGRNLWALRLPAIIASLLSIFWMFKFRDFFGRRIAGWAALAMAVSPGCVFYARYSIHEWWLVFFEMLTAWGALGSMTSGHRKYMTAIVIGMTGMILTKETWVIHAGCFGLALGCLLLWERHRPSAPALSFPKQEWHNSTLALYLAAALVAIIFFYSGNFLRFDTLGGLGEAYIAWFKTGVDKGGHVKTQYELATMAWSWLEAHKMLFGATQKPGWFSYFAWLNYYWFYLIARYEWVVCVGILACFPILLKRCHATIRLLAIYACGVVAAYTIVPYKTPWCIVSLLWPFFLTFGYLVEQRRRVSAMTAAGVVIAASLALCVRLNFFHYADHQEPYVYVQTDLQVGILTKPIFDMVARDPENHRMRGQILIDSYYPLPWILGEFPNISYCKTTPEKLDGDFIIAPSSKAKEMEEKMTEPYYRRKFLLRDAQEDSMAYFRVAKFAPEFPSMKPEVIPHSPIQP